MTHVFVTKILSLAAAVTLVTVCVLVAVPKNAGGKLGPQPHTATLAVIHDGSALRRKRRG